MLEADRYADVDRSEGWDAIADQFIAARSGVGAALVRSWARDHLPHAGTVLDVGCGSGIPIAQALDDAGFAVPGIDASPALLAAFRRRFPDAPSACEAAQDSAFFHCTFDAAIAIGLIFLLTPDDQRRVIGRIAAALRPGARFLFSAPRERRAWHDTLTGRRSQSLGQHEYAQVLSAAGLHLTASHFDEGGNHYFDAVKVPRPVTQVFEP